MVRDSILGVEGTSLRIRVRVSRIILTWSALLVCGAPAVGAVRYTVIDLGSLGGLSSRGYAINNLGQVTGILVTAGGSTHAFRYSGGSMADLGTAGGSYSYGYAINTVGQIAGTGDDSGGAERIVLYQNGGWQIIPGLEPQLAFLSDAFAINDDGVITGQSNTPTGEIHAFLYAGNGTRDLGTLGGPFSYGYGINRSNHVTGVATFPRDPVTRLYPSHAFLHDGVSMLDLLTLGGDSSVGYGINDAGQIAGSSQAPDGEWHAALYAGGFWSDLGTLGGTNAGLRAINQTGEATGYYIRSGDRRALVYEGNAPQDLNDLIPAGSGWILIDGYGINDQGLITGEGSIGGQKHAFLSIPVPDHPTLLIQPAAADQVLLSWPGEFGPPWKLQTAPEVLSTTWSDITAAPFLVGGRYLLTNTTTAEMAFFRLYQPFSVRTQMLR